MSSSKEPLNELVEYLFELHAPYVRVVAESKSVVHGKVKTEELVLTPLPDNSLRAYIVKMDKGSFLIKANHAAPDGQRYNATWRQDSMDTDSGALTSGLFSMSQITTLLNHRWPRRAPRN